MVLKGCTKLRYVHQDHLSGTAVITDANGNEVGSIKYYPYGETRSTSGTLETDKKFTGQRLDDTGLYYYNARYYDPAIGRFISPDTLVPNPANPQAFNRYSYCLNNPLKYTDPSGHFGVISAIKFAIGMTKLYVSQGAKALTKPSNIQNVLTQTLLPSPSQTASTAVSAPQSSGPTLNREKLSPREFPNEETTTRQVYYNESFSIRRGTTFGTLVSTEEASGNIQGTVSAEVGETTVDIGVQSTIDVPVGWYGVHPKAYIDYNQGRSMTEINMSQTSATLDIGTHVSYKGSMKEFIPEECTDIQVKIDILGTYEITSGYTVNKRYLFPDPPGYIIDPFTGAVSQQERIVAP